MKLSYPYEKFYTAVNGMATSSRSLADRIEAAYMSFHPIREEQLEGEIAERYSELMLLLTKVKDGPKEHGYVVNTLNAADDEELRKIADLIFDIFTQIYNEHLGESD